MDPRGTGDNAQRTGTTSIQPCQIHERNGASAFYCCCCHLTLSWIHYCFCGTSFVVLTHITLSRLCWTLCLHVSTIYPFLTLPDTVASWEVCMLVFPLSCVSPCPIPPNVQFRYPEVHYRQWICRDFLLIWFYLFFFPNSKISFLPSQPPPPSSKIPLTATAFYPLLSPWAVCL